MHRRVFPVDGCSSPVASPAPRRLSAARARLAATHRPARRLGGHLPIVPRARRGGAREVTVPADEMRVTPSQRADRPRETSCWSRAAVVGRQKGRTSRRKSSSRCCFMGGGGQPTFLGTTTGTAGWPAVRADSEAVAGRHGRPGGPGVGGRSIGTRSIGTRLSRYSPATAQRRTREQRMRIRCRSTVVWHNQWDVEVSGFRRYF